MSEPVLLPELQARHPGTQNLYRWLTPNPNLLDGLPSAVADQFHGVTTYLVSHLVDHPELTEALRHLLSAKDAAVRAALHTTWQQEWTKQPSEDIS